MHLKHMYIHAHAHAHAHVHACKLIIRLQRKELLREGLCRLSDTYQRAQLIEIYEDEVDNAPDSLHLHVPHALAVLALIVCGQPQVRGHAQQVWHMPKEAPHACMPVRALWHASLSVHGTPETHQLSPRRFLQKSGSSCWTRADCTWAAACARAFSSLSTCPKGPPHACMHAKGSSLDAVTHSQ